MRRPSPRLLVVLLAAVAVCGAGCQESGFDESKETVRPLKVQHVLGETKVPGQAEQPLTLTDDTLDDTLALGVRPAGAAVPGGRLPAYLRDQGRGISLMAPVTAGDLPALEAIRPDLILGSDSGQGKLYDDLSRIAPTVMTDGGGEQWKLNVRLVGEALGRTNDAEQLLIDYDAEAARARQAIADRPRVAVVRVTADGLRYAPRDSFAGTILADAGVRQVTRSGPADVTLVSGDRGAAGVNGRSAAADEALWWGSGGALAARAALLELQAALGG
ncbi:MAG: iron-siderophore transport system substrate-binding protein [Thermoleophilaceae bacterium]|nr:iron-siderophore transport system substrate-binding protein [Thermoleophilaceae bacterium]